MPTKIYASPTRKGYYEIQTDEGPIQQINALDKEALASGDNIIRIVRRETALTFNTVIFSDVRDADNATVGATRTEVLAYLNTFLGGIEGSGDGDGGAVQNNYSTTEVALKNPDGSPLLWTDNRPIYQLIQEFQGQNASLGVLADVQPVAVRDYIHMECKVRNSTLSGGIFIDANEHPNLVDVVTSINPNAYIAVLSDGDLQNFIYKAIDKTTRLAISVNLSSFTGYVLVRYTKSTDSPIV